MHACMAMIFLASQRHSGMTPMTGVWQWKDTGFLGRTDKADEEAVFALYVNIQLESMEHCLVIDEEPAKSLWIRTKERAGAGGISVRVWYSLFHQGVPVVEALCREMGGASHSQTLVLMDNFNHSGFA